MELTYLITHPNDYEQFAWSVAIRNNADENQRKLNHRTMNERLNRLIEQLTSTGPDHFNQFDWFSSTDDDDGRGMLSEDFPIAVDTSLIIGFNVNACGSAACLGGHGALTMIADPATRAEYPQLSSSQVAFHFGIPDSWFQSDLVQNEAHPAFEIMRTLSNDSQLLLSEIEWIGQLAGLRGLANAHHSLANLRPDRLPSR